MWRRTIGNPVTRHTLNHIGKCTLQRSGPQPTFSNFVNTNWASSYKSHDHSLIKFEEMVQRQPLPPVEDFNQLLHGLVKNKQYGMVLELFKKISFLGVRCTEYTLSMAISSSARLNQPAAAFSLLGYCIKRNIPADSHIYSALLNALVIGGHTKECVQLFRKLVKEKACEPNVVIFSTLINGLCKAGDHKAAAEMMIMMESMGCPPNVVSYNTIIDSLVKNGWIDDALELFQSMVAGKNILPSVRTYTSLMQGLTQAGRLNEVVLLLADMGKNGIEPDVQVFTVVMSCCCASGDLERAYNVLKLMAEKGVVPDTVTYTSLIDAHCKKGDLKNARILFDAMLSYGPRPNTHTINVMINGYCELADIEEGVRFILEITTGEYNISFSPDDITYSTLMKGYFNATKWEAALQLFHEMKTKGFKPNEIVYTTLLHGLCKNSRVKDALAIFDAITEKELKGKITLQNVLIEGTIRAGSLNIAMGIFKQLCQTGPKPNESSYRLIIGALCNKGFISEAKYIFLDMEKQSLLNGATCNLLLQGLLRHGRLNEAEGLIEKMMGLGYSLEEASKLQLVKHMPNEQRTKLQGRLTKKGLLHPNAIRDRGK